MHPAFSVLFFTVTSGAGYGMMMLLIICQLSGVVTADHTTGFLVMVLAAIVLVSAGLISSTFHLANPKNVWRSLNRFRTSWLSREGVFALLYYPLVLGYVAALWSQKFQGSPLVLALGGLSIALGLVVVFCTGMIYASLKTLPQWHTPLVPVNFLLFSTASGLVIVNAALYLAAEMLVPELLIATIAMLLVCAAAKSIYYYRIGRPSASTLRSATTLSQAQVRLFDAGHSSDNFLNREFGYRVGPRSLQLSRRLAMTLGFVVPLLASVYVLFAGSTAGFTIPLLLAALSIYLGLLLERWLFFVEARHVVRFYEMQ